MLTIDPVGAAEDAAFVGSRSCAGCHARAFRSWSGSDHDLAMQEATQATVLGDFDDEAEVRLTDGTTYRIVRRNSQQIQVYVGENKITAKPILRRVISEKKLKIPLSGLSTRQMGRRVLDDLRASNSGVESTS
jgi:hypothetical protein